MTRLRPAKAGWNSPNMILFEQSRGILGVANLSRAGVREVPELVVHAEPGFHLVIPFVIQGFKDAECCLLDLPISAV